jgi:serine/threonine protein phosphatase PrpC
MIRASRAHLYCTALSHMGVIRKNNEDNFSISAYHLAEDNPLPTVFAILADGIGGHKAGEVAAELVVNGFSSRVAGSDGTQPIETLKVAFAETNQRVLKESNSSPERNGMGATLACAWVIGNQLYTATVGDSRVYLGRAGVMRQLSTDHTWVQEAIDKGLLDPQLAMKHPNAHVIRRYVGSQKVFDLDFRLRLTPDETDAQAVANQGMLLVPGDVILLCSDGLSDLVDHKEILRTIQKAKGIRTAAKALVDLACQRGGHDNITVLILFVPWDADKKAWYKT